MRKFEFRPWGWFITLDEGKNYKVKKIYLKPNTKLSLQYHHHRDEHWTVVEGSGKAIVNKNVFIMNDGDDMFIAKKAVHLMEASPDGVTFIEVQRGKCDEEDIVRLQALEASVHEHDGGSSDATLEDKVNKIINWLEQNTSYYGS